MSPGNFHDFLDSPPALLEELRNGGSVLVTFSLLAHPSPLLARDPGAVVSAIHGATLGRRSGVEIR
jgi:hypothetical protein